MNKPMRCPDCGRPLRPNKGWAAMFYDGYCSFCDMPVEDGICVETDNEEEMACI